MQVSIEATDGFNRRIKVTVPASDVKKMGDSIASQIARNRRFPGFRPGKVPVAFVAKECRAEIEHATRQEIARSYLYRAILDAKIENISEAYPLVTGDDGLKKGEDFSFYVEVEVNPEVNFDKDLGELELNKKVMNISEDDVELMVNNIRKAFATFAKVDREAKNDDKVTVKFEEVENGDSNVFGREVPFVITDQENRKTFFNDHIIGHKAGDVVEFNRSIKDAEGNDKEVAFKLSVVSVEEPQLPELNEEFVKKINPEGTLETLRDDLRKNIERELTAQLESENNNTVLSKLLETYGNFELPPRAVSRAADSLKAYVASRKEHATDEQIKNRAEHDVKFRLILGALIKKFEIKEDHSFVEAYLDRICSAYEQPEEVKKQMKSNAQQMEKIADQCLLLQVTNFVYSKAKVTEVPASFKDYAQQF